MECGSGYAGPMSVDLPAPRILQLFDEMEGLRASDLFLTEGRSPAVRVDGSVRPLDRPLTSRGDLEQLLNHALTRSARSHFDEHGDLDAGLSLDDGRRFRLNIARQQGRISVVARAVPRSRRDGTSLLLGTCTIRTPPLSLDGGSSDD